MTSLQTLSYQRTFKLKLTIVMNV